MVTALETKEGSSLPAEVIKAQQAFALGRQFSETREADEVWNPVKRTICAGGNLDPWHPSIFPNIFERLSFLFLHPILEERGAILFAPSETDYIFNKVLGNKQVEIQEHAFPSYSHGTLKPDGLIVIPKRRINLLVGVMEATTCTRLETNLQKQHQLSLLLNPYAVAQSLDMQLPGPYDHNPYPISNELGNMMHKLRPREIPNLPVSLGLAKNWELHLAILQGVECNLPVKKHPLPFDHQEFESFANFWLWDKLDQAFPDGWYCKNEDKDQKKVTAPSLFLPGDNDFREDAKTQKNVFISSLFYQPLYLS